MSQSEAWIITALGMAVVYIGLVACIGFIQLFGRISRHVQFGDEGRGHAAATAPPASESAAPAPVSSEPVPADVLAIIALVLELERKLYMNRPGARVTIRRHAPAP